MISTLRNIPAHKQPEISDSDIIDFITMSKLKGYTNTRFNAVMAYLGTTQQTSKKSTSASAQIAVTGDYLYDYTSSRNYVVDLMRCCAVHGESNFIKKTDEKTAVLIDIFGNQKDHGKYNRTQYGIRKKTLVWGAIHGTPDLVRFSASSELPSICISAHIQVHGNYFYNNHPDLKFTQVYIKNFTHV